MHILFIFVKFIIKDVTMIKSDILKNSVGKDNYGKY